MGHPQFKHLSVPPAQVPSPRSGGGASIIGYWLSAIGYPLGCLLWLAVAGCATHPSVDLVLGPGYHPANIYGQEFSLPLELRRVALLPVSGAPAEEVRAALGEVLESELAKTKRFELVRVSPGDLEAVTGQKVWAPTAALPVGLGVYLRQQLGCDGVLLAGVTQYRPYAPVAVGWNLKLVDLHSGQIVWAADEVFDGGQTAVANSARRYRLHHSQLPCSLEDSRFILLSPGAFGHYTADALFATLPPQLVPQPPVKVLPAPADKKKEDRKST